MSAPKLLPALLGGLFIGVLSSLPLIATANVCCCLWVVCGGALAAWLMQQNTPRRVTYGEGAIVGLMAGIVGTIVWCVLMAGLSFLTGGGMSLDNVRRAMEEADMPPETREAFQQVGPIVLLAALFIGWGVINMIFAVLGGLGGVAIFGKKAPPASPGGPIGGPPTFTPPSFNPPVPPSGPSFGGAPPAPPSGFTPPPPPSSPASFSLPVATPAFGMPPSSVPPAPAPAPAAAPVPEAPAPLPIPSPADEPYAGDAPTIMIPRAGNVPGFPAMPKPATPAPPAPEREPDSH